MRNRHRCQGWIGKRIVRQTVLGGGVLSALLSGIPAAEAQLPPLPTPQQVDGTGQATGQPPQNTQALPNTRLQVYTVPSDYVGMVGAQLQIRHHGKPGVSITTDPNTGQLMVMAPDAVQEQISKEVTAFMRQNNLERADRGVDAATNRQLKYQLQHLSWRELEDAILQLTGPDTSVETERNGEIVNLRMTNDNGRTDVIRIDRRMNEITLIGTNATVAGWSQVINSLDRGQADARNRTHVVPLAPAEPRGLKRAIRLVNTTVQQDALGGGQAQAEVDVQDDDQATAIGSIDDLGTGSGLFGDVQIEFIDQLGVVIVRGSESDVRRTLEVIEKIKAQAAETQPEIEVYPLEHANNQAVAELVTELYADIFEPRQGAVSITALGQPNALLLIGRPEVVQSVKDLVAKIDQPLDPRNQLKVIRLLHASSVDVESRIREFFVENPGDDEENRAALGTRVKVLADYRTNSLIVQAAPREMVEVEKLIDNLDVESTTAENAVRVFRLKNTLAEDMQEIISEVITGQAQGQAQAQTQAGGGQATPPSGKLSIVDVDGGNVVESGILAGVVITADPSVNALVVRAPAESMALIEKLINELDQLPSAEARIKVFQLQNGDATALAQTLQSLFGLPVTAGQGAGNTFLNSLSQASLTTGGESSLVQLQIAVDARTNSIIVSGGQSDLEVFEVLLLRLDEDVRESRMMEVVWLRNANAQEVATALTQYFGQQAQAYQFLNNGINQILSPSQLVDKQVFIVPEPATNSILISAVPEMFDSALAMIERLDRRPPLVSIQVLIAEVRLDDSFEFGTEWGLQDGLLFDRQSSTGGTLGSPIFNLGDDLTGPSSDGPGQTQNVAGQALSSFGVGRASATGIGGMVLSASSETVGALVRALQTSGRLQILNRPTITTLDSREASTLVGQRVPRVQGVTQAQFGQTVNAEDEDVGLGLAVLPRVNQDGLILMQVEVQNSSIDDVNSGVPVGFGPTGEVIRSPIINTTEAQTTVSAYSGQTVVFAGLISKQRATQRSQIPFLGSLPWVGPLFRFDSETEQRRELLVVLTPRIIQTDEDYEVLKQVESSRMSWCLADILNMHGDVGLSPGNGLWGPAKSQVIYPDLQPTVLEDRSNLQQPEMLQPDSVEDSRSYEGTESMLDPVEGLELNSNAEAKQTGVPMMNAGFQRPTQLDAPRPPLNR